MSRRKSSQKGAIPLFATEDKEREFWATHDSTGYIDWSKARSVAFPRLKPSTATISLRLPVGMLEDLRILANERDVPYQSLLKVFLAERIGHERGPRNSKRTAAAPSRTSAQAGYRALRTS